MSNTTAILNPSLFNPRLYQSILTLWFQDVSPTATTAHAPVLARWFGFSPPSERAGFDTQCCSTAEEALASIAPSRYPLSLPSSKVAEPFLAQLKPDTGNGLAPEQTALALVLLLDQLSRNCFRDSQKDIYTHYDRISRGVLQEILHRGLDAHERYRDVPPWRLWFYMPLMHSENAGDHEIFEAKLAEMRKQMRQQDDQDAVAYLDTAIAFEKRHKVIVDRFGRYPHRNTVIGRENTVEETKYLEDGGETFGT